MSDLVNAKALTWERVLKMDVVTGREGQRTSKKYTF
jgi:hypothetical protein